MGAFATLFDFDGVLVDSEPVHLAAFNDVLGERGIAISDAEYMARYVSFDDAGVFRAALADAGQTVDEDAVRSLVLAKSPRFLARFGESFREYPGARELVRRRATRGPVGIVSGARGDEIAFALERMGLRDAVSFVVSADDVAAGKPDPAPYVAGRAAAAKVSAFEGVVAIEDSPGGIASARAAGVRCVAVSHTFAEPVLAQAGASFVARALVDLDDAVLEA